MNLTVKVNRYNVISGKWEELETLAVDFMSALPMDLLRNIAEDMLAEYPDETLLLEGECSAMNFKISAPLGFFLIDMRG